MDSILNAPLLEDDNYSNVLIFGLLPKKERRFIIHNFRPEVDHVAAIEIQRIWRGYRVRSKFKTLFKTLLTEFEGKTEAARPVNRHTFGQALSDHPSPSVVQPKRRDKHQPQTAKQTETRKPIKTLKTGSEPSIQKENRASCSSVKQSKQASNSTETQSKRASNSTETQSKQASNSTETQSKQASHFTETQSKRASHFVETQSKQASNSTETQSKQASHFTETQSKRVSHFVETQSKQHQQPLGIRLQKRTIRAREGRRSTDPDLGQERDVSKEQQGVLQQTSESLDEGEVPAKHLKMTKKSASRLALEASYDRYVQKALKQGQTSTDMLQFTEYCAHRIQIWWLLKHRVFLRERFIQRLIELQKKAAYESAAVMEAMIQEASRNVQKKKREGPLTEREAAISIQRAWRRHIDIQVYRYYRDLINFKTRGNPSIMLRCINPNEAKLLDAASGTSVRFRLAGDRFPPNIYYKIFTHRPVQDMCANSPKDYTVSQAKDLTVRHKHNKVATLPPQQDDKDGWYKRSENNGWRLVSDRLIHHIMNDPITWESSKKTYQFDHSKLKRKQDVEKQKKTRKIEWMKKMYKQGMLRARADDQETVQLIEGAAAGMMATVDNQGPEALEDWEVDELLDWTTSLNFEEYFSTWKDLATSAAADTQLEKSMSIGTSKSDPYELTVSTAPSRFQSTRQSRHTPATLTSGSIHIKT